MQPTPPMMVALNYGFTVVQSSFYCLVIQCVNFYVERSSRKRRSTSRERDRVREEKSKHRRDGGQGEKFDA